MFMNCCFAIIGLASKLEYNWDDSGLVWGWWSSPTVERYITDINHLLPVVFINSNFLPQLGRIWDLV